MALKNAFRAELKRHSNGQGIGNEYWDAFSGGKTKLSETKYTPFDGVQRTYVALPETENITLEAEYEETIHGPMLSGGSEDLRGEIVDVAVFDLVPGTGIPGVNKGGQYQQNRAPLHGRILEVVPPDGDSNTATDVAMIQIIVSVGETNE